MTFWGVYGVTFSYFFCHDNYIKIYFLVCFFLRQKEIYVLEAEDFNLGNFGLESYLWNQRKSWYGTSSLNMWTMISRLKGESEGLFQWVRNIILQMTSGYQFQNSDFVGLHYKVLGVFFKGRYSYPVVVLH